MEKLVQSLAILIILVSGCAPTPRVSSLAIDEVVYESLFLHLYKGNYEPLYIANATESLWFKINPISQVNEAQLAKLQSVYPKLLKQLYEVNEKRQPLNWIPDLINARFLKGYYANIENGHVEQICYVVKRDDSVEKFTLKSYLRAYYSVSRVAYSKDKKIALLKYTYHCTPTSGSGTWLVTLRIENDDWQVIDSINHWQGKDSPFVAG